MDPTIAIQAGIQGAKVIGKGVVTVGKGVYKAGGVVNNWLKEVMPLEDRLAQPPSEAEFPPLCVQVSQNLEYKIKLLENTAKLLGTDAPSAVKGIVDQINDDTFKVLIVGKFGAGKSALLNKLLERDILKTGAGETTKTLAWLWYGEKELAWYHDYSDDLHAIQLDEIVNIPEDPPVYNVFACIHADILNHGAVLIDTPGLAASDETAALTNKAMESADAVILVVDNFPVEKHDRELVEKLQKEGKTGKLFVVINKMDKVEPDEQDSLIEDRKKLFSGMGVRAHIFPLSCKDLMAADNGFAKFRKALVEYIETNLQAARDASVSQRIKNTAAEFSRQCEAAAEFSKIQDEQERAKRREAVLESMKQAEQEVKSVIRANLNEIRRLENNMLANWDNLLSSLKNEVYVNIQNASDVQLKNLNQLFGNIQAEINKFLLSEFNAAEEQIRNGIIKDLNGVQLPLLQREGQMAIDVPAQGNFISKIDPNMGTWGLLAFTFFTNAHGFFSTAACLPNLFLIYALGPFINKIFEQVLKTVGAMNTASLKTKLHEKINEQWGVIDDNVRSKINGFFKALSDQTERNGEETINSVFHRGRKTLTIADSISNGKKVTEIEDFNEELKKIIN